METGEVPSKFEHTSAVIIPFPELNWQYWDLGTITGVPLPDPQAQS